MRNAPAGARPARGYRGASLVELLCVLALTGGVAAVAISSGGALFAALDVTIAAQETAHPTSPASDPSISTGARTPLHSFM